MVTIFAPAKINLTLEVLGRRADGYHEVRTVLQAIDLCDILSFELAQGIDLQCSSPGLDSAHNLVVKAAVLLQKVTGCRSGVSIRLAKLIPSASGLGGGASDAAATFSGLNELWELGFSPQKLARLAPQLSSDAAFFIHGGTALARGRGEKVIRMPSFPDGWVVLLRPPLPEMQQKTEQLYARLNACHFTRGQFSRRLSQQLRRDPEIETSLFFNVFEMVAFDAFPGLGEYWQRFLAAGASSVHLAGSGPTLFTLVGARAQGEEIHCRLRLQGLEAYLARTLKAPI
jgi:4-diphosphocytidyl-2-C-methyl-D-erythritol kinase